MLFVEKIFWCLEKNKIANPQKITSRKQDLKFTRKSLNTMITQIKNQSSLLQRKQRFKDLRNWYFEIKKGLLKLLIGRWSILLPIHYLGHYSSNFFPASKVNFKPRSFVRTRGNPAPSS